jgi:hypothetical protein
LNLATFFGGAVVLLQAAASFCFMLRKEYAPAVVWFGAGLANAAILWMAWER